MREIVDISGAEKQISAGVHAIICQNCVTYPDCKGSSTFKNLIESHIAVFERFSLVPKVHVIGCNSLADVFPRFQTDVFPRFLTDVFPRYDLSDWSE